MVLVLHIVFIAIPFPSRNSVFRFASAAMPLSGALLRRDGGEVRPALLDILAVAVRADDLSLLMFGDGQTLREFFLAGVTEELVVGHQGPPKSQKGSGRILDPGDRGFNMATGHEFCVVRVADLS